MKAGCLLFILSIGLIWGGGQGTYTSLTNRTIHEYSIGEYLKTKPDDKWIRITGGVIDMGEMSYSSGRLAGKIKELYVPVVAPDAKSDTPVHILFHTEDPKLLQTAETIRGLKTETEALRFAVEHPELLSIPQTVEGLIEFGIDVREKELMKLKSLNPNLSKDFVILKHGEQPKFFFSFGLFLCGLLLLGWQFKAVFSKKSESPAPPPPYPSGNPPPAPPAT